MSDRATSSQPHDLSPEARQLVENAVARARQSLKAGAPLREVLALLTSVVETLGRDTVVASILVLDREGLLRNGASPNLPADYLDAIDRLKPDARVGTCAAAAATGEVVETPSFFEDSRWSELRHLPMALGFAGAWSMPIKGGEGRVLGTFGTYFRENRRPTPAERAAVEVLATVAAEAIAVRGAV